MANIRCEIQINHKIDGWTDITNKVNKIEVNRGLDRRTGRAKAGVCTIRSVTTKPWVAPWAATGVWDQVTLIGSPMRVMLTVFDNNTSTREVIYTGSVAEIEHETSELLHFVNITCLDLWGDKIAHAYLDAPAIPEGSSARTRFNSLMDEAGFTISTDYTGTASLRKLAPDIEKPKQRLVDSLQLVIDSENGYLFVDRFNVLHFIGRSTTVPTASVVVSDTPSPSSATFVRTPQILLDMERLVNAVIVIAANPENEEEPYNRRWGTAGMGSVKGETEPNPATSIKWEMLRRDAPSDYFALRSVRNFTSLPWVSEVSSGTPWLIPKNSVIEVTLLNQRLPLQRFKVVKDSNLVTLVGGKLVVNAFTFDRQNNVGQVIQIDQVVGHPITLFAPATPVSYSVPWKTTGEGKGTSGATETVRTDPTSIKLHGRYERRVKTSLREEDTGLLADEILRERSELTPVIPDVDIAVNLEPVEVARKLLALELDSHLQIEFTPRGETSTYSDLSPVIKIRYQILPLDMADDLCRVSARYTLFRSTKPTYWILGTSKLGTETVVGPLGSTITTGQWVDGEVVDIHGVSRIQDRVVARYPSSSDMASVEGTPVGPRYAVDEGTKGFMRYNPANKAWGTIGTFK